MGKIEKLEASLIGAETQAEQYHEELEQLRRKYARMEKTLQEKEQFHVEIVQSHKFLDTENKTYQHEIREVQ